MVPLRIFRCTFAISMRAVGSLPTIRSVRRIRHGTLMPCACNRQVMDRSTTKPSRPFSVQSGSLRLLRLRMRMRDRQWLSKGLEDNRQQNKAHTDPWCAWSNSQRRTLQVEKVRVLRDCVAAVEHFVQAPVTMVTGVSGRVSRGLRPGRGMKATVAGVFSY